MGKAIDHRLDSVAGPPEGEAWVWHTITLRSSPAWKARSPHLARLVELLELEHLRHGGAENGHLHLTYSQIDDSGIPRKYIAQAIAEGEALGLIAVEHGVKRSKDESFMNTFRLTYLATRKVVPGYTGLKPYFAAPSNEWKRVTDEQAQRAARAAAAARAKAAGRQKISSGCPQEEPNQFLKGNSGSSSRGTTPSESRRNARPQNMPSVPQEEHPSISWPGGGEDQPASVLADTSLGQPAPSPVIDNQPTDSADQPDQTGEADGSPATSTESSSAAVQPAQPSEAAMTGTSATSDSGTPARRQRARQQRDSRTVDIEAYISGTKPTSAPAPIVVQVSPVDRLRVAVKAKLSDSPKGTHKRLADAAGVSSCHLSNFVAGKFGLTHGALARLQDWVAGRLDLSTRTAAA